MMVVVEIPASEAETALTVAYREHYRSLVKLAALLVDDVGRCEEIVQDAFVAIFSRRGRMDDSSKLAAYLRSAVLNGARSQLRKRSVRERPATLRLLADDDFTDVTSAGAEQRGEQRAVLEALRGLPERQRDAIALRFWGGLSESEIAATLGISAGTVKTHMARGFAALATTLEGQR